MVTSGDNAMQGSTDSGECPVVPWWQLHPAYEALVQTFKGSTRSPEHLAFLALTGLASRGFFVVEGADQ